MTESERVGERVPTVGQVSILRACRAKPKTGAQVARETQQSEAGIYTAMRRLLERGLLRDAGSCLYELTEEGRRVLRAADAFARALASRGGR